MPRYTIAAYSTQANADRVADALAEMGISNEVRRRHGMFTVLGLSVEDTERANAVLPEVEIRVLRP